MQEIRNPAGRLVCRVDESSGVVEILTKGILTRISRTPAGTFQITHARIKLLTA